MKRPYVEQILEQCKTASPGPGDATRKTLSILCEYILYAEGEAKAYRLALENLTPGGSEFYKDIERCVSHIQDRFDEGHRARKDLVRLRRKNKKIRDHLIRDMNGDGTHFKCSCCGYTWGSKGAFGEQERHDDDCPLRD